MYVIKCRNQSSQLKSSQVDVRKQVRSYCTLLQTIVMDYHSQLNATYIYANYYLHSLNSSAQIH